MKMAASKVQYREYKPQFFNTGSHPGKLVESFPLASVRSPNRGYVKLCDIEKLNRLSAAQKDAVFLAIQQFEQPNTKTAGFLLGDGPGVGKSRIIAGIMNYYMDRAKDNVFKSIWVTVTEDLESQIQNEFDKVSDHKIKLIKLKDVENPSYCSNVLLCTYTAIAYERKSTAISNIDKIIQYCGQNFDGIIALDECQRAKNLKFSEAKSTAIGLAIKKLQNELPQAKIIYSSATSISEPEHFLYMDRLQLWGENTCYQNFPMFSKDLSSRGVFAMELLVQHLKCTGRMIARKLSCQNIRCTVEKVDVSDEQRRAYDHATTLWREAYELLYKGKEIPSSITLARYWAAQQRFFRNFCLALKVDKAAAIANEAISRGDSVVFGIQSTGEAASKQSKSYDVSSKSVCEYILVSTIKDVVLPHLDASDLAMKLIEKVRKATLPDNFLDSLIEKLGGKREVSEMTGRLSGGKSKTVASKIIEARQKFQTGRTKVAIISDVASTGLSLHDDFTNSVSRKRVHVTLELPWSAEKTIQQLGRTNRANQFSCPDYIFLTTSVCGETRFAAAVVHKLQQLGALTQGSRNSLNSLGILDFDFDYQSATSAVVALCEAVETFPCEKFSEEESNNIRRSLCYVGFETKLTNKNKLLEKFMNRLLGVAIEDQELIFKAFINTNVPDRKDSLQIIKEPVILLEKRCLLSSNNTHIVRFLQDVSATLCQVFENAKDLEKQIDCFNRPLLVRFEDNSRFVCVYRPIDGLNPVGLLWKDYEAMEAKKYFGSDANFELLWSMEQKKACANCGNNHKKYDLQDFSTFPNWFMRSCKYNPKTIVCGNIWDNWNTAIKLVEDDEPMCYCCVVDEKGDTFFGVFVDSQKVEFL